MNKLTNIQLKFGDFAMLLKIDLITKGIRPIMRKIRMTIADHFLYTN